MSGHDFSQRARIAADDAGGLMLGHEHFKVASHLAPPTESCRYYLHESHYTLIRVKKSIGFSIFCSVDIITI